MPQTAIINFNDYYRQTCGAELHPVPKKKARKDVAKTRKKSYNLNNGTDIKAIMDYFLDSGKYIHYLIFVMGLNFGRRIGDTLAFKWNMFYKDGQKRKYLHLDNEEKTGKEKDILINEAVWKAIEVYCAKTGCNPIGTNKDDFIALQLSGTHKGRVLSYEAYRLALKAAGRACNIEQNIGSHTTRKTMGYFAKKLHPTDEFSTSIISGFLNHSSEGVTRNYIGLSQEMEDEYVSDMGDMMLSLMEGKEIAMPDRPTDLITVEYDDLRQIIQLIYQCGRENAKENDLQKHLDNIDVGMEMIREIMK
jgi:integrase